MSERAGGASQPTRDATILGALEREFEAIVAEGCAEIFRIPTYQARDTPEFRDDVRRQVDRHLGSVLRVFAERRAVTQDDVTPIRDAAARRQGRVSIADFVGAFETGQQVLWDHAIALGDDAALRGELLELLVCIRQYFHIATVTAAEVYLEAEHLMGATGEQVRRDLLHELLAGSAPTPGPRLDAARAAGLEPSSPCLVITAVGTNAGTTDDEPSLRSAAAALARVAGSAVRPLTVVRGEEIVIVLRAPGSGTDALSRRLAELQRKLAKQGAPLAVAMSTVYEGYDGVREAYGEAVAARERLFPSSGTVALPTMTTFEYLTWRSDPTARHLIRPAVARFVERDAATGGVLIGTLDEYYRADLNAKLAAERLHLHVNTVYYRLDRIAEQAQCNVRQVADVVELLIAARLTSPS